MEKQALKRDVEMENRDTGRAAEFKEVFREKIIPAVLLLFF